MKAPRIITGNGECFYFPREEKKEDMMQGLPVSAGIKEGRIKILNSPEEGDRLAEGDILVTRGTNPSWTPLFINIGALIMETGGHISHGSVVARELLSMRLIFLLNRGNYFLCWVPMEQEKQLRLKCSAVCMNLPRAPQRLWDMMLCRKPIKSNKLSMYLLRKQRWQKSYLYGKIYF